MLEAPEAFNSLLTEIIEEMGKPNSD